MAFMSQSDASIEFTANHIKTSRDLEYFALLRIVKKLQNSIESNDRKSTIEAIYENNQLWTAFAADLINPGNALPDNIKLGLVAIAIYSIKRGGYVLKDNVDASVLVEINLAIMKGLRS
jgi:flagellar protein FlaF